MDPRSEVLLRQAELFQGKLLLVGLPADDLLGRLPNAHGWCWHAGDQAALDAYQNHPQHLALKPFIGAAREERQCMDYES